MVHSSIRFTIDEDDFLKEIDSNRTEAIRKLIQFYKKPKIDISKIFDEVTKLKNRVNELELEKSENLRKDFSNSTLSSQSADINFNDTQYEDRDEPF